MLMISIIPVFATSRPHCTSPHPVGLYSIVLRLTNPTTHDDVIKWKHFCIAGPLCGEFTGEFPSQRPVTWSFYVFFDLRLNKRLSKQSGRRYFETLSRPLWRHSSAYWSDDPLILQPIRPTAHWSFVSLVLRPIGPMCHWPCFLEIFCHRSHWSYDSLILWFTGPTTHWPDVPLVLHIGAQMLHGPLVLRPISPTT